MCYLVDKYAPYATGEEPSPTTVQEEVPEIVYQGGESYARSTSVWDDRSATVLPV